MPGDVQTLGGLMRFWAAQLHGAASDPAPELFSQLGINPDDPLSPDEAERHDYSVVAIAFAALSLRFMIR